MEIVYNGERRETADGASVAKLLEELQLPPEQVAVEVNLELVPRSHHAEHTLKDGDTLEVVRLVGGG